MSDESTTAAGPDSPTDGPEAYTEPAGDGPGGPGLIREEADAHAADSDLSGRQSRYEAGAGREAAETSAALTRSQAGAGREAAEVSAALTRSQAGAGREAAEASAALTRSQADAHQDLTTVALARIANNAEALTSKVTAVYNSYAADKEEARTDRRRYAVAIIVALATLALLMAGVFGQARANHAALKQVADTLDQTRANGRQLLGTQKLLISCSVPGGACKKRDDAAIVQALQSLNRAGVLRVACAPDYQKLPLAARVTAIEACVTRNLPKGAK